MKKYLSILLVLACLQAYGQGTAEDYRRAYSLAGKYNGKMTHGNVSPHAIPGTDQFWYTVTEADGISYKRVEASGQGSCTPLFDKQHLAGLLEESLSSQVDSRNLQLDNLRIDAEKNVMTFHHSRTSWEYDLSQGTLVKKGDLPERHNGPQRHWMEVPDEKDGRATSPDKSMEIFHKDNNLYVLHKESQSERQLTTDGTAENYYSSWGSFSPDGRYYATVKIKPAPKHLIWYTNSSPSDQLQPKYFQQQYTKPGDSLNYRVPVVVEVATGKVTEPSTELFANQYEVSMPQWNKDSQTLMFDFNERGHHRYRVLELNAETGQVRTLVEERSDKYVNYNRQYRHIFEDGSKMIWMSERDNYAHLYLVNLKNGKIIRQITKGEWYVRGVQRVDEKKGVIYFSANGMNKQEDPYLIHYYKIDLSGKNLVSLTPEEGNHKATFTDDMTYLIDTYSTVTNPPVSVLRSATDGHILLTLETADITALEANGWKAPEVFTAKGRDGQTDMWGIIQRPTNFDPSRKYPIIEYIYSGPGDQYVPKSFTPMLWNMATLAELGFIVVQLDAMGTSFRSKSFEEVCYKNLKDAGFPDRIAWIKAAAAKYPYMDADRVGIFGASAGGQEAMGAVLFHGDFYKAAYSSCGCHDNRMDKIWWNEQWMSYPIDSSYIESSNMENAAKLERPLMLVVGELDDNVDPSSTFQVVNALIKANKNFEFVYLPGVHHTMGESYGEHKRFDFFVKHLLGVDPPEWKEIEN